MISVMLKISEQLLSLNNERIPVCPEVPGQPSQPIELFKILIFYNLHIVYPRLHRT